MIEAKEVPKSRVLHCTFDTNTGQLVDHGWGLRQDLETNHVLTALEEPVWECRDRATNKPIRAYDFTDLFRTVRMEHASLDWQFYKNVIPYAKQRDGSILAVDLVSCKATFASTVFDMEANYQAFMRRIEHDRMQTMSVQFVQFQSRMLQKIAMDSCQTRQPQHGGSGTTTAIFGVFDSRYASTSPRMESEAYAARKYVDCASNSH